MLVPDQWIHRRSRAYFFYAPNVPEPHVYRYIATALEHISQTNDSRLLLVLDYDEHTAEALELRVSHPTRTYSYG